MNIDFDRALRQASEDPKDFVVEPSRDWTVEVSNDETSMELCVIGWAITGSGVQPVVVLVGRTYTAGQLALNGQGTWRLRFDYGSERWKTGVSYANEGRSNQ